MPVYKKVEVLDIEDEGDVSNACYYEAIVRDVAPDGKLLIGFDNDWRDPIWVMPSLVRSAAPPKPGNYDPSIDQAVEVKARQGENEPYGWWKAVITTKRNEENGSALFMVHFEGWDDFDDIVSQNEIRPRNGNPSFAQIPLHKVSIPVPKGLPVDQLDESLYAQMQSPSSLFSVYVAQRERKAGDAKHSLVCIGHQAAVKNARLLAKLEFKHRKHIQEIRKERTKDVEKLKSQEEHFSNCEVLTLNILDGTIGIVIGKGGSNIKKAQKIKGVESVKVKDEKKQVIIVAVTREAANAAREILEIVKSVFPVPVELFGRFVGKRFKEVEEIKEHSGVISIRAAKKERFLDAKRNSSRGGEWDNNGGLDAQAEDWADSDPVPKAVIDLEIVGNPSKVESARILLSQRIRNVEEIDQELTSNRAIKERLDVLQNRYGVRNGRGRGQGGGARGRGEGRGGGEDRGGKKAGGGGRGRGRGKNGAQNNKDKSDAETAKKAANGEGKKVEEAKKTEQRSKKKKKNQRKKKNQNKQTNQNKQPRYKIKGGGDAKHSGNGNETTAAAASTAGKGPLKGGSGKAKDGEPGGGDGEPQIESKPQRRQRRRNKVQGKGQGNGGGDGDGGKAHNSNESGSGGSKATPDGKKADAAESKRQANTKANQEKVETD
eukprot:jgi/Bigna1/134711/aug1.26_g9419